ncbi:MAG: tetratricopeptide repeat protein, partial [Akkermansiaceae bacterium]|nr:tetratricopeptide repeat protein [Akkermansiaceae bacterium]
MNSKLTRPYIQDLRNNLPATKASKVNRQLNLHCCVLTGIALTASSLCAQNAGANPSSIAQREIARRANLVVDADKALGLGRAAYAKSQYEEAVKQYQIALRNLPSGPAVADRRQSYNLHLGDASTALAQEYRRVGRIDEARALLDRVLAQHPENKGVREQLAYLDDPIRTNPSLTFEHTQNVDQVRRSLYTGEGHYNLGKYDEADTEFKKVLQIDPYNKAARRWLERVAATKSDYYRAAYDQTRAELLKEVDKAWETTIPPELPDLGLSGVNSTQTTGVEYIQQKLKNIIVPDVDFTDITVNEALEQLSVHAKEFDYEPDENKKGVNFIIRDPKLIPDDAGQIDDEDALGVGAVAQAQESIGSLKIDSLQVRNVPLGKVLQYICDKTRLRTKIDEFAVILLPVGALEVDDLYTRTYTVPPDFISRISQGSGGGGNANDDPFADDDGDDTAALGKRASAQSLLKDNGISFPESGEDSAFANFIASSSTLVVYNTLNNLDLIDDLVAVMRKDGPRQVRIMTKFIEVAQENTDELGFDWVLGGSVGLGTAGGNSNYRLGAGTTGNGVPRNTDDLGNPSVASGNIATAGLRSGDYANTRNSISSIINNPTRSNQVNNVAPGILSITGLFNDHQAQVIMRGLAQKKGTDVMTA